MRSTRSRANPLRGHHWRTWLITAGALVLTAALAAGVAALPLFAAKTIDVEGMSHLKEAQVLEAGGVTTQTNLIYFSTATIEARLERQPWIRDASVERTLPSTLTITIQERIPAAVGTRGGAIFLIAADGTTLEEVAHEAGLPSIRGVRPGEVGDSPEPMRGPAAAAAAFDPVVLQEHPVIEVGEDGQITLLLHKNVPVLYGDPAEVDDKALAIAGVLAWADLNKASIISMNVTVPHAPTAELEQHGQPVDSGIIPISNPCPPNHRSTSPAQETTPTPTPIPDQATAQGTKQPKTDPCATRRTSGADAGAPNGGATTQL